MASDTQCICRFPLAYDAEAQAFWVCGHSLPIVTRGVSNFCEEICLDPDARLRRHDRAAALARAQELRSGTAGTCA
ncbi:hypothetical protein ACIA8C_24935 [Nocardia sp. NPDC051321]|uniref:hypothetical protein n=1 Tax=Nocardia sp. NPDC051321 TaxID=3364323 RepID=UPI0037A077C7